MRDWKFHRYAADPQKDFGLPNLFPNPVKEQLLIQKFNDSAWQKARSSAYWTWNCLLSIRQFDVMAHGYKPVGGLPFPARAV